MAENDSLKVLVPTDFSESASHALGVAGELAGRAGGSVLALHAYHVPSFAFPDGAYVPSPDFVTDTMTWANRGLDDQIGAVRFPETVKVEAVTQEGVTHDTIDRVAEERRVDLVVMASGQRSGIERWFLGSTAERTVRVSRKPVLVLPGDKPLGVGPAVLTHDLSEDSLLGCERAAVLLKRLGLQKAYLMHVNVNPWTRYGERDPMDTGPFKKDREVYEKGVQSIMNDHLARIVDLGLEVLPLVEKGEPVETIGEAAKSREASLVVVNATGKGAVERALLGSTTVGLLRESPVPVLVMPPGDL